MALRTVVEAISSGCRMGRGLGVLYSSTTGFLFNLPQSKVEKPPAAEPSTNLFPGLASAQQQKVFVMRLPSLGKSSMPRVVTDRVSGYSEGLGFVKYATIKEAEAGIKGMDGQFLDGWVIFAEYARPRQPVPPLNNAPPQGQWGS